MKLQILQENLGKAVNMASRFTSTRAQLPVLGNILLSASKTKLNVSSTNLEISVSIFLGAKVEEMGEISIPSKIFAELIQNLTNDTLTLEAEKEQLKITSSGFSSKVLGMDATDFPKIPGSVNKEKGITLSSDVFAKALGKVLFAASSDETRPILTGVLFILAKGELSLVATDGFRLSQTKIKIGSQKGELRLVLPKLILSEVGRAEGDENIYLELIEKEKQAIFGVGDVVLSSRILEGDYPDFEKIIPKTSIYKVTLDKEEFLRSIKLSAPFARDNANIVKFKLLKDGVKVSAESSQGGNQETKVDAKLEGGGEDFEIAFNYKFVEDFIQSVAGEEIQMEFSTLDKAGVFTDPSDPDFLHLIMPVRVQT
jgi:DNA polymerase-3 subunit beta